MCLCVCFHLFERQRDRVSIHCFSPQIHILIMVRPGQSQGPRSQSGFPMWVTGIQVLEPTLATFQAHIRRKLDLEAELRREPRQWDVGSSSVWATMERNTHVPCSSSNANVSFLISCPNLDSISSANSTWVSPTGQHSCLGWTALCCGAP